MMKNQRDRTGANVKSDAAGDPARGSAYPVDDSEDSLSVGPYGADIAPPQVNPEPAVQA
jgi:hypothetical protein